MCGIFGIVTSSMRSFDFPTFCTLGIANDSRGGDSCGYFIDGHYEYGAKGDDKWFQCFFQDNKFLNDLKMRASTASSGGGLRSGSGTRRG